MADREGAIPEWCVDAIRREPPQRAAVISRAKWNRRLAPGVAPRDLWAEMQPTGSGGTITIALARHPDRPPRQVTLAVTAKPVPFQGARRLGSPLPPGRSGQSRPRSLAPPGEEPVAWWLRTSLPVADCPRACTVGQWERWRWDMELLFRVLKPGCQIEPLGVQTDQRLLNALAIDFMVAWRIHTITMAGHASPEGSCEVVFEPQEWHPLYTRQPHCHPPPTPPPRREMVRSLAQLGGFLARKGDGEPGIKTIWQGCQRLHDFICAVDTYRKVETLERNVSC
jgi:hypothetical protein